MNLTPEQTRRLEQTIEELHRSQRHETLLDAAATRADVITLGEDDHAATVVANLKDCYLKVRMTF